MSTKRERDIKDALDEYLEDGEGGAQMFMDILHRKGLTIVSNRPSSSTAAARQEEFQPTLEPPAGERRIKRKGY